jgi:hypothetical protein
VGDYAHGLDAVLVLVSLMSVALDADVHLVLGSVPMVIQRQGFAVAQKQIHTARCLLLLLACRLEVERCVLNFNFSHNDLLIDAGMVSDAIPAL